MYKKILGGVQLAVILLFVATYAQARGQSSSFSTKEKQGFSFLVLPSTKGKIGHIYFAGNEQIACLDGRTGHAIWFEKGPGFFSTGLGVGPVVAGDTLVYMAGGSFFIAYGLDLYTGKKKWMLARKSPALAAGQGVVFLATQGGLWVIAVDARSGKIEWRRRAVKVGGTLQQIVYSKGLLYTDSPYVWDAHSGHLIRKLPFSPNVIIANKGRIFLSGDEVSVVALDAQTGKRLWEAPNPLSRLEESSYSVFLAASNRYLVGAFYKDTGFGEDRGVMRVYNAATGRLLWEKKITSGGFLPSGPVNTDSKFVYLIEPSGKRGAKITAFEGRTGKQLWTYSSPNGFFGPVVSVDDTVLFNNGGEYGSGQHATLYALNRKTGLLRWKFSFRQ